MENISKNCLEKLLAVFKIKTEVCSRYHFKFNIEKMKKIQGKKQTNGFSQLESESIFRQT